MRVRATRTVEYEIFVYEQSYDDPDDGTPAGTYAQVGEPHEQCIFLVGPYLSRRAARAAAVERLERMGYAVERSDD